MIAFLTGVTGFFGEALLRELLSQGAKVRALVPAGSDTKHLSDLKFEQVEGDLSSFEAMRRGAGGAHVIFHTAFTEEWHAGKEEYRRINTIGTKNVMSVACKMKQERVVIVGGMDVSVRLCSPRASTIADGIEAAFARNNKGLTKEMEVLAAHPGILVGPRDRKPGAFGGLLLEALRGEKRWLPSGGLPLVDVEDAARNTALLAERGVPGAEYNFVADYFPMRSIFGALNAMTHHDVKPCYVPGPAACALTKLMETGARLSRSAPRLPSDLEKMIVYPSRSYPDGRAERRTLGLKDYRPIEESLARAHQWWIEAGMSSHESAVY